MSLASLHVHNSKIHDSLGLSSIIPEDIAKLSMLGKLTQINIVFVELFMFTNLFTKQMTFSVVPYCDRIATCWKNNLY